MWTHEQLMMTQIHPMQQSRHQGQAEGHHYLLPAERQGMHLQRLLQQPLACLQMRSLNWPNWPLEQRMLPLCGGQPVWTCRPGHYYQRQHQHQHPRRKRHQQLPSWPQVGRWLQLARCLLPLLSLFPALVSCTVLTCSIVRCFHGRQQPQCDQPSQNEPSGGCPSMKRSGRGCTIASALPPLPALHMICSCPPPAPAAMPLRQLQPTRPLPLQDPPTTRQGGEGASHGTPCEPVCSAEAAGACAPLAHTVPGTYWDQSLGLWGALRHLGGAILCPYPLHQINCCSACLLA